MRHELANWPQTSHCNTCGLDCVTWYPGRGGRFLHHDGGKNNCRFPCKVCDHLDCADVRKAKA
jgi:hypothetical protein